MYLDTFYRIHLEWMFENQPELVRQLNRSNELGSYLEKKIKQASDLFLKLKEEQSLSEEDACRASVVAILEPRDGLATSDNLVDPLSLSEQKEICRKLIYQKFSYTELSYIQRAAKATEPDSIDEDEEDNR